MIEQATTARGRKYPAAISRPKAAEKWSQIPSHGVFRLKVLECHHDLRLNF